MKRLLGHCGLFQVAVISKAATEWAKAHGVPQRVHTAFVISCLLVCNAFGQDGDGYQNSAAEPEGGIADIGKAAAFRERCLLLTTKFKHEGVDFQSKSGIGCIISTPQGQRILAMPASMTKPEEVVQRNNKFPIVCSMLLATKFGNTNRNTSELLASFAESVDELPLESKPKQLRKEPMMESERRIFRALDEQGEVSFNAMPLSSVMRFFKDAYSVPIVIDEQSLEAANVTAEETITLELPTVTFRSALRLILNPLNLTFVIENEVLKITTRQEAERAGADPISHWNPVGPELDSERKIFRALSERGELNFKAMPLFGVIKWFRNTYGIPIVIDEEAVESENLTPEEPISLELPAVSFRSALTLILEPLNLTYVIENEVLLITSKTKAMAEHPATFFGANPKGLTAFGTGMGGGMGSMKAFSQLSPTQRYSSFIESQRADSAFQSMRNGSGRREYAAIHGPLATSVDKTLGVAFVSLPGDFQAVLIPTRVEAGGRRFVMLDQSWFEITKDRDNLASVVNGSPVIDQRGEPIGMFIDQKVVSLPELVQSLLEIDSKHLGYWGAESKENLPEDDPFSGPPATFPDAEFPALVTTEIKKQIERVASLKGEAKGVVQRSIHSELDKRIELRKKAAEEKLKSVQSKLERLKQLSDRMNKQDEETLLKLLTGLEGNPAKRSEANSENDPFK